MVAPGRRSRTFPRATSRSAEQYLQHQLHWEPKPRRSERPPVRCAETARETAAARRSNLQTEAGNLPARINNSLLPVLPKYCFFWTFADATGHCAYQKG